MEKAERKISKTERIISIYHLLRFCDEVSMQELTQLLPGSKKTFSRDIALLKKAGLPIKYSAKRNAFVLGDDKRATIEANGKSEQRFLEKLSRLIEMIDHIPSVDCDIWYAETFPQTSKRTMQRDFAVLNAIGYEIKYEREMFNSHDAGYDVPPRHYYCDKPDSAYGLNTFRKGGF